MSRFVEAAVRDQRFGRNERRLQRVERRCAGLQHFVGADDGLRGLAAPQGEPGAEHADGPFVPAARLTAVRAVGFARAAEKVGGGFVLAANQMNLRQRIEHRAGRLVELDRTANVEGAVQRILCARQIAEPDADLAERGERDGEAVAGSVRLVQDHAALGERKRLLVAVLQHHHVRLIAADGREHVVGGHRRGKPLGLPQRHHRFVVLTELRHRDAGE